MDNCKKCNNNKRYMNAYSILLILIIGWIMGVCSIIAGTILLSINYNEYSFLLGNLTIIGGIYIIADYSINCNNKFKKIKESR